MEKEIQSADLMNFRLEDLSLSVLVTIIIPILMVVLTVVLRILRKKGERSWGERLTGGAFVAYYSVFIAICLLELAIFFPTKSTLMNYSPEKVGKVALVISFLLFSYMLYNQFMSFVSLIPNILENANPIVKIPKRTFRRGLQWLAAGIIVLYISSIQLGTTDYEVNSILKSEMIFYLVLFAAAIPQIIISMKIYQINGNEIKKKKVELLSYGTGGGWTIGFAQHIVKDDIKKLQRGALICITVYLLGVFSFLFLMMFYIRMLFASILTILGIVFVLYLFGFLGKGERGYKRIKSKSNSDDEETVVYNSDGSWEKAKKMQHKNAYEGKESGKEYWNKDL